jgi:hypothetical protein
VIGNYFISGPSSSGKFAGEFTDTDHIYQSDNYADIDRDGQLNGKLALPADFPKATIVPTATMTSPVPVTVDSAADAYHRVVAGAGDALHRDAIDARMIEQVKSLGKEGAIIHDPAEMGGFGQIKGGPVPSIPVADPTRIAPSGYTALEEYLNRLTTTGKP